MRIVGSSSQNMYNTVAKLSGLAQCLTTFGLENLYKHFQGKTSDLLEQGAKSRRYSR